MRKLFHECVYQRVSSICAHYQILRYEGTAAAIAADFANTPVPALDGVGVSSLSALRC